MFFCFAKIKRTAPTILLVVILLLSAFHSTAQPDTSAAWVKVEQMPFFAGCEHFRSADPAKRACSDKALAAFITSKLVYPDSAVRQNIEGMVIVSFVVDEQGNTGGMRILHDIGGGCGAAAAKVVEAMPKWEPAVHEGRKTAVRLNLPVQFAFKRRVSDEGEQFAIHWGKLHGDSATKADLENNLQETILVRDAFGNLAAIRGLEFLFEKGKKSASAKVAGAEPDKKMQKIAAQAEAGGAFTVNAEIQYGNGTLLVTRTFEIK